MQIIVIYHANCTDGFCCAFLMHKAYPQATFIPFQYGTELDISKIDPQSHVYILDFSFKRDVMLKLREHVKGRLIVLDHHKTAQAECEGLDFCRFDMNRCGAKMTYEFLVENGDLEPHEDLETFVEYVNDRDLWRNILPGTEQVSASLRSYPFDFAVWEGLVHRSLATLIFDGGAILRYRQGLIDRTIKKAYNIRICEYTVKCAECHFEFISEVAQALIGENKFGVTYFDDVENHCRVFSLRSREDFDVSEIAKRFGGGGHKQAAGFSIDTPIATWNECNARLMYPSRFQER